MFTHFSLFEFYSIPY